MKVPQVCRKFKDKNAFYSKTLENISPRLLCPLNPGNYTIQQAALSMEYLWVDFYQIEPISCEHDEISNQFSGANSDLMGILGNVEWCLLLQIQQ